MFSITWNRTLVAAALVIAAGCKPGKGSEEPAQSGGAQATGGATGSGGEGSGGAQQTGGTAGSGGAQATGGSSASGGVSVTGGMLESGGTSATGGSSGTGGTDTSTLEDHIFLPTDVPTNTTRPRLKTDAQGNLHALYPAYAGGDAYYAYCPDNCEDPSQISVVPLRTSGTVTNAMLTLTQAGQPRVLLATYLQLIWAQCDAQCEDPQRWTTSVILTHGATRDVTGPALALDSQDRPRFIMHAPVALFGIGQAEPKTWFAQCDDQCDDPTRWRYDVMQDSIFHSNTLLFDALDRAHLSTAVQEFDGQTPTRKVTAYLRCDSDCRADTDWQGVSFTAMYESEVEEITPALSMALTSNGDPRMVALGIDDFGGKQLIFWQCEGACEADGWSGVLLSERSELGSGVDLVVDAADNPRFVFALNYNIGLYSCDVADCTAEDAPWKLTEVELSTDLPADDIILWPNCTFGAWFLHDPTLTLGRHGSVRVGYQATDISGGVHTTDPTKPPCVAGKDMTLSRLALLPSYGE